MTFLFWLSTLLVLYAYAGYPLAVWGLARWRGRRPAKAPITPSVTVVITAHNEARVIRDKIENTLALDYPADRLEILVGSDGSTDGTDEIVAEYAARGVRLHRQLARGGKAALLAALVPQASGEIVVLSDARQRYAPDAVRELAANFADVTVGCVSGVLELEGATGGVGAAMGFYRAYEQAIRDGEGRLHSTPGATGAIYAIRRELFIPPHPDTILDDLAIPLAIVAQGKRAVYEPRAVAVDRAPTSAGEEFACKVRTLAGNYQALWRARSHLLPWRSPMAWSLFSHKLLRLVVPYLLLICLAANAALAKAHLVYAGLMGGQLLFYMIALLGAVGSYGGRRDPTRSGGWGPRGLGLPYTFVVLNIAAVAGLLRTLRGGQSVLWHRPRATASRSRSTVYR
jgi:biofilm PGA synthesis N-glycosyltransferase PgaC